MNPLWKWIVLMLAVSACLRPAWADTASADDRASIRNQLAAEYFKRRQYSVAIDEAKKAIAASPKYAPAYSMLALINMEIREDAQARSYFQQALQLSPKDSDIHHNYGYFLCDRGEFQAGINEYLLALGNSLYATPEKTLIAAGVCAEKAGKIDEARGFFERALRYQPNNNQAKYQLAALLLNSGNIPQARVYALELARQANPTAEVLWLATRIEHRLGVQEGERRYAEQLRRVYPESLETSKLLAGQFD